MTESKGALRKAALLDAAEAVLVTKGNANAAMRDFAAAAGVRIGHLQHYFPTRADLIRAVLERTLDRSLQRLTEVAGLDLEPEAAGSLTRDDSRRLLTALLQEHSDLEDVKMHLEIWALASSDEQAASALRSFYAQYAAHVQGVVRRGRSDLHDSAAAGIAAAIVSLFEGAAVTRSDIAGLRTEPGDEAIIRTAQWLIHGQEPSQ
ncbi:TetR family transcriptional regulator [Arthrobacter sp. MYb23]|uniref:TetR/AcrR family transcriptional regulator n=1 Tax=unclassified Arthrobacter TaxID=235627 RepID=UPI000CFDE462|nr:MULTISPECIES: TetR/AcrR family transcriptional regulator [unclassified Arthrobacter]PRB37214.1 TetR family transcriptional regulator [Arthrobacter sp. MYb51]PRB90303.1 TetR family transcriptional regulator [Arthrobacter sp. MYb23]